MKFYLVYIEATWSDTGYVIPLIVKADNITKAKARAKKLWRETYGGMGKASTPMLDVDSIELITKKTDVLELAEVAPHQNELLTYNNKKKLGRLRILPKYKKGGLFNLFPDLTEKERNLIAMALFPDLTGEQRKLIASAYKNPQNSNKMDGACNGFSRVVVPSELNGFTRVNYINPVNRMNGYTLNDYELNDYELNGRTARRIGRWYKRNAPWSYIGTAVAGVVVADVLTKGAVRKKLGLKK